MLIIKRTSQFKKDFKLCLKQDRNIKELKEVISLLVNEEQLDAKFKDHSLSGKLKKIRECHLEPDWLLLYQCTEKELKLIRLGSHSELFK